MLHVIKLLSHFFKDNQKLNANEIAIETDNNKFQTLNEFLQKQKTFQSAEEVVGTWIEKKKIYRRVFQISSLSNIDLTDNLDTLISISCTFQNKNNSQWRLVPWVGVSNNNYTFASYAGSFYINYVDNVWRLIWQSGSDLTNIKKGIIILTYTKQAT